MPAAVIPAISTFRTPWKPNKNTIFHPATVKTLNFLSAPAPAPLSWAATTRTTNRNLIVMTGIHSSEDVDAFEQEALVDVEAPLNSIEIGFGIGIEATLNNLSKWLMAAIFTAIIIWKHDGEALWAAMGSVLNSLLSVVLKGILNQDRLVSTLRSDPGMPSSHAQSIFYSVVFLNLSMVEWIGMNALSAILSMLFFVIGSYFSWLRVSQKLHTLNQIVVGAVIGSIFSILWLWLWIDFVSFSYASSLLVRIMVITLSIGFCSGFFYHAYHTWTVEER